jgi:hypothetical protein
LSWIRTLWILSWWMQLALGMHNFDAAWCWFLFLFAYGYHKETLLWNNKAETLIAIGCRPLDANLLDLQMCIFKLTMNMKAPKAMAKPFDINPMTKLWVTITNNA